jgi:hypothetical protein
MANCAKVGWNCHSTVSGLAGIPGTGDGVNGTDRFYNPYGLVVAADGSLVVADTYNELVRAVLVPFKLSLQVSGAAHTVTIPWDAVVGKKYQFNSRRIWRRRGRISVRPRRQQI